MNFLSYIKDKYNSYQIAKKYKMREAEKRIRNEITQVKHDISKLQEEVKQLHILRETNSNIIKKCIDSMYEKLQTEINELKNIGEKK